MPIQSRIFLGYVKNKEMTIHLNQNPRWREGKTLGQTDLVEIYWQEKEYIGRFIPSLLNCIQIKKKEGEVKTQLQLYCPKLNLDKHSVYLLSQLFIF